MNRVRHRMWAPSSRLRLVHAPMLPPCHRWCRWETTNKTYQWPIPCKVSGVPDSLSVLRNSRLPRPRSASIKPPSHCTSSWLAHRPLCPEKVSKTSWKEDGERRLLRHSVLQYCVNITSLCCGICTQHWLANVAVGARLGYRYKDEYHAEYKHEAEFYHGWDRKWSIGSTRCGHFVGQETRRRATWRQYYARWGHSASNRDIVSYIVQLTGLPAVTST